MSDFVFVFTEDVVSNGKIFKENTFFHVTTLSVKITSVESYNENIRITQT